MLLDVYIYDQRETHWWRRGHPGLRRFSQCVFKRIGSAYFYEVENTVVGGGWRLSCTQWVLFGGLLKKIHIVTNWPNKSGINVQSRNIIYTHIYIYILCYTHAHYNVIYLYYIEHIIIIIIADDRMRTVITRSAAVTQHVHTLHWYRFSVYFKRLVPTQ